MNESMPTSGQPTLARSGEEIAACFPVMSQLRPHLDAEDFVRRVSAMLNEGYELAYLSTAGRVCCVAGFRVFDTLAHGRSLYVDDLVTDDATRSGGHGAVMIDWLKRTARRRDCANLHLDSGVRRAAAHRFYFRHGFAITSYHFALDPRPDAIGPRML